jgi:hypothetical protein
VRGEAPLPDVTGSAGRLIDAERTVFSARRQDFCGLWVRSVSAPSGSLRLDILNIGSRFPVHLVDDQSILIRQRPVDLDQTSG